MLLLRTASGRARGVGHILGERLNSYQSRYGMVIERHCFRRNVYDKHVPVSLPCHPNPDGRERASCRREAQSKNVRDLRRDLSFTCCTSEPNVRLFWGHWCRCCFNDESIQAASNLNAEDSDICRAFAASWVLVKVVNVSYRFVLSRLLSFATPILVGSNYRIVQFLETFGRALFFVACIFTRGVSSCVAHPSISERVHVHAVLFMPPQILSALFQLHILSCVMPNRRYQLQPLPVSEIYFQHIGALPPSVQVLNALAWYSIPITGVRRKLLCLDCAFIRSN